MQRLGIQFRGARFENMVPKPPGIHLPIVPGSHKSQIWAAPGAYRQWKGWKVSAIVAFNALQRHTLFSTESINLSLAVCEAQLLLPWKKNPTISVFYAHALLGRSKQPSKPPCLTPERNLLVPDPLNIPHKICSCLFCTCLLSQTILARTMGGPGFPHTESLGLCRNTFSLSCCHSQPPEEMQAYGQALSTFWKSKGTLSNMGSVCIYTEVPAASVGFSLLFSLFSFQRWLCTWEH